MATLSRQNEVPASGPKIMVRRLKAGQRGNWVLLCRKIWGCYVHWAGNHSIPCYEPHSSCPGHQQGLPRKWKGYLCAGNQENRRVEFLEFTPTMAEKLLDQIGPGQPLRGMRVRLERGRGDNARVAVEVFPRSEGLDLSEEVDPEPTLRKLWGREAVLLSVFEGNGDSQAFA